MKGIPNMFDAVLFDFNGTLFFDGALQENAWRTHLGTLIGRPVTDEEFRDHIHGRSAAATFSYFLRREVPQTEAAELEEQKERIYRRLCLESPDFHLEAGVPELLDALKARGIPFTIATASALPNTRFFFEHLPLSDWFDFEKVVYSDGTLPGKPAPDLYLKAAKQLGADPTRCIIFEDAKSGILAAKNACAAKVVGVTSSMTSAALKALGADVTIDGYTAPDLIDIILS